MVKFWVRLYKDNKLCGEVVVPAKIELSTRAMLEEGLRECCYQLDLSNPMIMKKHLADIKHYSLTRFLPDEFPEHVAFDRMEVNFFEENSKKNKA